MQSEPVDGVLREALHLLDPLGLTMRSPDANAQDLISFKDIERTKFCVADRVGFLTYSRHTFGWRTLLLFFFRDLGFVVALPLSFSIVIVRAPESLFPKLTNIFCAGV